MYVIIKKENFDNRYIGEKEIKAYHCKNIKHKANQQ
jgi:hypothetical protein